MTDETDTPAGPLSGLAGAIALHAIDPRLKQWANKRQCEVIDAVNAHRTRPEAASALGMNTRSIRETIQRLKLRAAASGYSPEHDYTRPQPEGFVVKGVSTHYGPDGTVRQQWVKSAILQETKMEVLAAAVAEIAEPFKGLADPAPKPRNADKDLLTVYPMGDPHIGMMSWGEETGEDFDLEIAERNLVRAVDQLVGLSPRSETGLIINLGDFFHADNFQARTARSNHPLDVDGRWSKVLRVGIRAMRRCIDQTLKKHKVVHVINEIGNHDDHSSIMLSLCLDNYYEREPRVQINTSPASFHWYRHGKCLLGVTHGDTTKADKLQGIMATDRAQDWGETKFRHWYTGHVHHDTLKEYHGCSVETFRTLAAKDAWHAAQGYRSGRDMKCDVWHKDRGRILRHCVEVEAL